MLVDTHLHLDLGQFDHDRSAVVERARAAGVSGFVLIGFEPLRWRTTAELCARYPDMVRAAGVHPNSAATWEADTVDLLAAELGEPGVVALGEIGLDFYRDSADPQTQRTAFAAQLELARALDVPVIIHQRAAEQEVLDTLQRFAPLRGVMHCFTGDADFAGRCVALGLHLGIGGVLTFPRSTAIRDAVRDAPMDRLLLETDAPFIAPQPWRGRRNQPAYVSAVAAELADALDLNVEEVEEHTTRNAVELFGQQLAIRLPSEARASV
jgi:TatD DNase family protein